MSGMAKDSHVNDTGTVKQTSSLSGMFADHGYPDDYTLTWLEPSLPPEKASLNSQIRRSPTGKMGSALSCRGRHQGTIYRRQERMGGCNRTVLGYV